MNWVWESGAVSVWVVMIDEDHRPDATCLSSCQLREGSRILRTHRFLPSRALAADVTAREFGELVVTDTSVAVTLSAAHGADTLCRSLDTLHVALALEFGATEFCSFDLRQSLMAAAVGLTVIS